MPKAAVDEDGDPAAREGDVWPDQSSVDPNRMIFPEPVPKRWSAERSLTSGFVSRRRIAAMFRERPGVVT